MNPLRDFDPYTNRLRQPPLLPRKQTHSMAFLAVVLVILVFFITTAISGALVGWLVMLGLGIAGVSVAFVSQAWPLGVILVVVCRLLFGGSSN